MRTFALLLALALSTAAAADENDAIALSVFDYINGWYEGDAARMESSLHPDLAKRIVHKMGGRDELEHMSAMRLVQLTRAGAGTGVAPAERIKEVIILDVSGEVASVKTIMHGWIDYMHLAKIDGRWVIVNVLWQLRDRPAR